MRIQITGTTNKKKIIKQLRTALNTIERLGVDEFKNVNFYASPMVSGKYVRLLKHGKVSDMVVSGSVKTVKASEEKAKCCHAKNIPKIKGYSLLMNNSNHGHSKPA